MQTQADNRLWCLENFDLIRKLTLDERKRIESVSRLVIYHRGDTVFLPGDPSDAVFFLRKGRVKLSHLDESGKRLTLAICEHGEPFGEMALAGEGERTLIAEALDDLELCVVTKHEFLRLAQDSPNLSLRITKMIGLRFVQIQNRLDDLLFKDVKTRLARLFLKLDEQFGQSASDGRLIKLRLTHQDLADLIGAARETTSATLGEFEGEGWIGKLGRHFVLKKIDSLRDQAR